MRRFPCRRQYVGEPGKEIMQGQVHVEVLAPKDVGALPLLRIHGAVQTATNWMGTLEGRKGWVEYFVEQGYVGVLQSRQSSIVGCDDHQPLRRNMNKPHRRQVMLRTNWRHTAHIDLTQCSAQFASWKRP
jgi:hypothetical protein